MVNHRILLVDDNPAIHEDFQKILKESESDSSALADLEAELFGTPSANEGPEEPIYELGHAYQGEEALNRVTEAVEAGAPFAMAFVDVRMPPGWDGIKTVGELWKVDPDLEVVLCTAYSDYSWDDVRARLDRPAQLLLLKKPFDVAEVSQMALALCRKWEMGAELKARMHDLEETVAKRTSELSRVNEELRREMKERQHAEAELRHANKLEAVGQLASGIAHEINTPIQFVGDSVHFLREAVEDIDQLVDEYRKVGDAIEAKQSTAITEALASARQLEEDIELDYIRENTGPAFERTLDGVNRVATIVRAMKNFARADQVAMAAADVNRALESTLVVARNELKYVADVELDLQELPMVECHIGDLNQVFLNLAVNAAHAIEDVVGDSGKRGTVRVSTRHEGDEVIVEFKDSGGGIPEQVRERIFDPFFTTKEVGRGTGQGLAIAHNIVVERHGGKIAFETELGQGTTFSLRLPVRANAAATEAAA